MKPVLRPPADGDRARWEELFGAYFTFYEMEPPKGGFDVVWAWIQDDENPFWCTVAEDTAGKIIGFVHYQLWHNSLSAGMSVYMADLFVHPDVRGGGAGRALIDHVLAFARGRGLPSVDWLTQDFNYPGRRLYDTYQKKTDFVFYSVPA
ncbi:MAG: GNAT family N-acetyltransferase [Pseudomonadota bacterium]